MCEQVHTCFEIKRKELNASHESLREDHEKLGKAHSKLEKAYSLSSSKSRRRKPRRSK
jgi:hypothetical protein